MSQHYISTTQYDILLGWDRPLQYFFGTVWNKSRESTDERIVFSTLELPGGGVATVAELARVLSPYFELPGVIRDALIQDHVANRGNSVWQWKLDGAT